MGYEQSGLYVESADLEAYGQNVGRGMKVNGLRSGRALSRALRRCARELARTQQAVHRKWPDASSAPEAVRWLLENWYLIRREVLNGEETLWRAGRLPASDGVAVALSLCAAFFSCGHWELSLSRLELFLRGFSSTYILSGRELAALPDCMRCVLIDRLCELCRPGREAHWPAEAFAAIFRSLSAVSSPELPLLLERADRTAQALCEDPAGVYPRMDEASRNVYRGALARLARRHGMAEHKAAQYVLMLARHGSGEKRHVGYWIFREPLGYRRSVRRGGLAMALFFLLTLFFSLLLGFTASGAAVTLLLLIPVSEAVFALGACILTRVTATRHMPRLEFADGIPEEYRTLCVVSCILNLPGDAERLGRRLEEHYLCNRDGGKNLLFAAVADLPDTATERFAQQETLLRAAKEAVSQLNEKYGGGFFLLTRPRSLSADGRYMGWERKRGALLETMRFLRTRRSAIGCACGEPSLLEGVRFLIVLDSDTRLPHGAARELAGALAHPLNRPVVDEESGVVVRGHGVISPQVSPSLRSVTKSDFSRIFAGPGGGDPYGGCAGQLYMDLWDSGGFSGKGILDVDAYLACCDARFPEGQVLSHDALEGAFLRGGFMGTTQVLDDFPATPLSYYRRMHRWARGDWQNLPWLFTRGRALPGLDRFKLFDSARRTLVPVATLACLCAGLFIGRGDALLAATAAGLCFFSQLFLCLTRGVFQPRPESSRQFFSTVYSGVYGAMVQTLTRLLLLPVETFFCADAIVRALWRMLISHKNMLQWQTSGQCDAARPGLGSCCAAMWPACLPGFALLCFSPLPLGKAAGLLWLLCPLWVFLLSLKEKPAPPLSEKDRAYLLECARDIWKYFRDFLTDEMHYLPPDNVQSQPPVGAAQRTSPTNIGFALLSCLCALDLGLESKEGVCARIDGCLCTLEGLEKWHGHLLNWYDTSTRAPLSPPYVSTVDSGNLCACLCAVSVGLREWGFPALSERAEALAQAMDFSPLYDSRRSLLYIGLHPDTGLPDAGHYDLLASEARLTAFLAIARGDVPVKLWRSLSRAQLQSDLARGMASWTGTMFEYLMPELLLPLYHDSLLYESAAFCLYVQRRKRAGVKYPWGCSESAFFALDPSMNYRYKAHGCAALALRQGMDDELVVAPYASFLALCIAPEAALRNLRRFDAMGMRGPYGFWEAADFTSARAGGGFDTVRCVMSHHLGMSMAAITNCLLGALLPQRFMVRPEMSACALLLAERIPVEGQVLRRSRVSVPALPTRAVQSGLWSAAGRGADYASPACCLLSGSSYSLLLSENGHTRALWGALSAYIPSPDPAGNYHGVELLAALEGREYSLLPRAEDAPSGAWRFDTREGSVFMTHAHFSSCCRVSCADREIGERRSVLLCAKENPPARCTVLLRFSPLLCAYGDYLSHPAFSKLGMGMRCVEGCLLVRRLPRGATPELFLCLACSVPAVFTSTPGIGTGRLVPSRVLDETEYFPVEPAVECAAPLVLCAGQSRHLNFALALGHSEREALQGARRILAMGDGDCGELPARAAAVLGLGSEDVAQAWALLPQLCLPVAPGAQKCPADCLWRFGISGDLPVICADFSASRQLPDAGKLMDRHLLLCACGADCDLVFLCHDDGSYYRPLATALEALLRRNGGSVLFGARGGVHIVQDGPGAEAVRACARVWLALEQGFISPPRGLVPAALPAPVQPPAAGNVDFRWDKAGRFYLNCQRALPPRAWTNLLCNESFGCIASESGFGGLWYLNAREYQLMPWSGSPLSCAGHEELQILSGGEIRSLFAHASDTCLVRYDFGSARWEKRVGDGTVRLRAFVPQSVNARVLLIDCHGLPPGATLRWRMDLLLAADGKDRRFCRTDFTDGMLRAQNDRAIPSAAPLRAVCSCGFSRFTCDGLQAMCGNYDGASGACSRPVFAAELCADTPVVLVCGCDAPERLRALADFAAAEAALSETRAHWRKTVSCITLHSPEPALDRLMNGWLCYQGLACRIMGRSSVYQNGGAYGFRDQLQDAVNLIAVEPALVKEHILLSCTRQYTQGDVQHWWHHTQKPALGVRTRCSDDLLWLPWALCEYVEKTGDLTLCLAQASYLDSPELGVGERDRCERAGRAGESGSVLAHCVRALELVLRRGVGSHGLLRIGNGDWNDGFDNVRGESVWLSWFFLHIAQRFSNLAQAHFPAFVSRLREACISLRAATENAWDGAWFLRGYYADGTPLGSHESDECRIDSLAQSFAVFCGGVDDERLQSALSHAKEMLYDRENGFVRLFTPPFSGRGARPGYIASYGPGFRENGGQYTHGAIWLASAFFACGRRDEGWALVQALLPSGRDPLRYGGEPYVLAADVYAAPGHAGEAGWTWYTGSAGWFLRTVTEDLLGLCLRAGKLFISPRLPTGWPGYEAVYRGRRICVQGSIIFVDGKPYHGEGLDVL